MDIAHHKYVFVAGLHRSGTTLLFNTLRDHPMISGFTFPNGGEKEHEGQHNQSVYPKDSELGGPGYFAFNPCSHMIETDSLISESNSKRLFSQWSTHWDLSKPVLLEKSPPNIVRTRFLQAIFPDSYFISIVRDPVVTALATLKWMGWPRHVVESRNGLGGYTVREASTEDIPVFNRSRRLFTESMLYTLFLHWITAHKILRADIAHVPRFLMVRYEDLVNEPVRTMANLYEFLSIPSQGINNNAHIVDENKNYLRQWITWPQKELSSDGRQFLEDTFSPGFREYDYYFPGVV
jgi:Sulfotransferase family